MSDEEESKQKGYGILQGKGAKNQLLDDDSDGADNELTYYQPKKVVANIEKPKRDKKSQKKDEKDLKGFELLKSMLTKNEDILKREKMN